VTLTYQDKYLPAGGSLQKEDVKKFMKRLRKRFVPKCPFKKGTPEFDEWIAKNGIRYYYCGEYGEKLGRPHYHLLLFNFSFPDSKFYKRENGNDHYRSEILEDLWSDPWTRDPIGHTLIGPVTYASAAYVARYIMKKITGKTAPDHYQGKQSEYTDMSRKPGIARAWYEKYKNTDVFPRDYIVLNGVKQKVPKYYSRCYELTNPVEYGKLREDRIKKSSLNTTDLEAAEKLQEAYDQQLKRTYEGETNCNHLKSSHASTKKPPRIKNRSISKMKLKPFARYQPHYSTPSHQSACSPPTSLSIVSEPTMTLLEKLFLKPNLSTSSKPST